MSQMHKFKFLVMVYLSEHFWLLNIPAEGSTNICGRSLRTFLISLYSSWRKNINLQYIYLTFLINSNSCRGKPISLRTFTEKFSYFKTVCHYVLFTILLHYGQLALTVLGLLLFSCLLLYNSPLSKFVCTVRKRQTLYENLSIQ